MIATQDEAGATLRYGFVSQVDAVAHKVRVMLPDLGLETWWLQVLVSDTGQDKLYNLPDIGTHVAVLLDRRGEDGVVLGALYTNGHRDDTPVQDGPDRTHMRFADGTTIDYDRRSHKLAIACTGDVEITSATLVTIKAPRINLN